MKVKLIHQNYHFSDIKCGVVFTKSSLGASSPAFMKCFDGPPNFNTFAINLETGELTNFDDLTILHPIEGVFTQENSNES